MNIDETLKERGQNYGSFETQAFLSQLLKEQARRSRNWDDLNPFQQEALEMILHKISRILNGNPDYIDSWHDIAGYATLTEKTMTGMDT